MIGLRRGAQILGAATVAATVFCGLAAAGVVVAVRSTTVPPPDGPVAAPSPPTAPGRLVVAFVAGASGTTASDLLAPYEIFASSPAFTTYVAAADPAPVMLVGGPALVPTYTFDQVDDTDALTPDLVVVPAVEDPTGEPEAGLRAWIARQHQQGARVLGVCAGARVLAATGMLDGHTATSHWSRIPALESDHPAVDWVSGRVYVDDRDVTTTGAVASGVPAALHLVARYAGDGEAQRVADLHPELGWTPATSPVVGPTRFQAADWPVALDFLAPWGRPTVGIALTDGVGELDAAAAFEVWAQSAAARAVPLGDDRSVTTRHGLVLLTTARHDAGHLDRVVVPRRGFTGALDDLETHAGSATAASTARMIGYPEPEATRPVAVPARTRVLLALSGALATAAGIAAARGVGYRHRGRSTARRTIGLGVR